MSEPYLAEIRISSFNFPPRGWAFCNGQLLPINQNQALFSILGTTYGGDGRTNFALPNLQARMPVHTGNGINLGAQGGEALHTLSLNEMPAHTHAFSARTEPNSPGTSPSNAVWAAGSKVAFTGSPNTTMHPTAVANAGGSQPHENLAPYLVLNFIIALQGIYPSRS